MISGFIRDRPGAYPIACNHDMMAHEPMNDTTTTQTEQPGTVPGMPPLVRPRRNRVIAGGATGVAARLGIGTGWVRAAFVIATVFGGAGLLLYIVGWLAIPDEGEPQSIAASKVADLEDSSQIGRASCRERV